MTKAGWIRLGVLVFLVALLELLCRSGVIPSLTMIPPSAMVEALFRILATGKFNHDIVVTLRNVSVAIAAAMVVGIAFAYNNFDNRVMYPMILLVLIVVITINMSLHHWEKRLLERRRRA